MRGPHAASKSPMEEIVGMHLAIKKPKGASGMYWGIRTNWRDRYLQGNLHWLF